MQRLFKKHDQKSGQRGLINLFSEISLSSKHKTFVYKIEKKDRKLKICKYKNKIRMILCIVKENASSVTDKL